MLKSKSRNVLSQLSMLYDLYDFYGLYNLYDLYGLYDLHDFRGLYGLYGLYDVYAVYAVYVSPSDSQCTRHSSRARNDLCHHHVIRVLQITTLINKLQITVEA